MTKKVDKIFLLSFFLLLILGLLVFISASFGIYARDNAKFTSIIFSQIFIGLLPGLIACFIISKIKYKYWQKFSFYIFILSILATILFFIPGICIEFN